MPRSSDTLYDVHPRAERPIGVGEGDVGRSIGVLPAVGGYLTAVLVAGITGGIAAAVSGDDDGAVALLGGQVGFWSVLLAVVAIGWRPSTPHAAAGRFHGQLRWVDLVGVPVGVFTQVLLLPALYLPFRSLIDEDELSAPAEDLLSRVEGPGLVAMGIGVIVVAPIVEELFFRGVLLDAMRRRWGTVVAVVASSAFFGATHLQPLQFAGLTLAGLVFAGAVVRTGRIGSAIAVHAGFNATTFVALVAF